MQDSIDANVRQVSEGVAPVLEVFLDGSTEVNVNRAEQCAFVSAPSPPPPRKRPARRAQKPGRGAPPPPALVSEIEELSRAEVAALMRKAPRSTAPPDVKLSLFVQLAQDLDEQARAHTLAAVERLTTRRDQLEDVADEIEAVALRVSDALRTTPLDASTRDRPATDLLEALDGLAESIPEGAELRRVVDDDTPIPRNTAFGDLVLLRSPPHVEKLGKARLTVIGPAKKHLERLRKEWKAWLESIQADGPIETTAPGPSPGAGIHAGVDLPAALAAKHAEDERLVTTLATRATIIATTDPRKVTPPNRASIMLLATEGTGSCLLTGDAAEEEILEGLEAAGRIQNGVFPCTVLKVQHHGSEHNLSSHFAETVVAEHYVFCADGAHHNPDPSVVKTVAETRRAADPSPFTLWFNCSPERTIPTRRTAMRAAIREATRAADRHPGITVKVLRDDRAYFDLTF